MGNQLLFRAVILWQGVLHVLYLSFIFSTVAFKCSTQSLSYGVRQTGGLDMENIVLLQFWDLFTEDRAHTDTQDYLFILISPFFVTI